MILINILILALVAGNEGSLIYACKDVTGGDYILLVKLKDIERHSFTRI